MKPGVEDYLNVMDVTILKLNYTECDRPIIANASEVKTDKDKEANTCVYPYSDIKIRWGRYPILRDALLNCKQCTGPVLVTDTRDTYFQRDPFGDVAPPVTGLQLFAEHRLNSAKHHFVAKQVRECRNLFEMDGPMLCSGTTIATRKTMLTYVDIMYHQEMRQWMIDPNCFFKSHGGDQAIMNFLFYSGKFDALNPHINMPRDGQVNTVGYIGSKIVQM